MAAANDAKVNVQQIAPSSAVGSAATPADDAASRQSLEDDLSSLLEALRREKPSDPLSPDEATAAEKIAEEAVEFAATLKEASISVADAAPAAASREPASSGNDLEAAVR